jgi:hypothetical protein
MEQRRFAGTRRADNRHKFAGLHVQIHAAERVHVHFAGVIDLGEAADGDDRLALGQLASHAPKPQS